MAFDCRECRIPKRLLCNMRIRTAAHSVRHQHAVMTSGRKRVMQALYILAERLPVVEIFGMWPWK